MPSTLFPIFFELHGWVFGFHVAVPYILCGTLQFAKYFHIHYPGDTYCLSSFEGLDTAPRTQQPIPELRGLLFWR